MATLEVQATGSPVLTLRSSEFLRILRSYPLAEGFPFRLMASTTEIAFEICPGGSHCFEPTRGVGVQLKGRRVDVGAKEKASFTIENMILRVDEEGIRVTLPTQAPAYLVQMLTESMGWSDPPDVVRARLELMKDEGLTRYLKKMKGVARDGERERQEKEQAAQAERDRQNELRRQQRIARKKAKKQDSKAALEAERERARRTMQKLQEKSQANLQARIAGQARAGTSTLGNPSETGGSKPKVRNKAASV